MNILSTPQRAHCVQVSKSHHVILKDKSYAVCFMSLMYMSPLIKVALGLFVTLSSSRETDAHTLLHRLDHKVWVGEWPE